MIFIFSAESARQGEKRKERRQLVKNEDTGGRSVGRGRVWQSVEGSGADQWHDGGNSGILTL